ncbi:MAG: hypothetical protein N2444_03790 [Methylocystis sp.]|nr:hypothetical protein [Methylocystis sp.]
MTAQTLAPVSAETLLWAILRRFETYALARYEAVAPEVINNDKRAVVAALNARGAKIDSPQLAFETDALIDALASAERRDALINQALLLELVGKAIYANVSLADVSSETRDLCALGVRAAEATAAAATQALREDFKSGEAFFAAMIKTSPEMLKKLTPFAETLDREIGPAFGLNFADLIGEFVSDVDEATSALGVDRKKLIAFLTNIMMET